MIKVSFNHHDFMFAIEGFVYGSHLRQHVWRNIVYKAIPQMSVEDMDYFWFFLRRDFFRVVLSRKRRFGANAFWLLRLYARPCGAASRQPIQGDT